MRLVIGCAFYFAGRRYGLGFEVPTSSVEHRSDGTLEAILSPEQIQSAIKGLQALAESYEKTKRFLESGGKTE